MRFQELPRRLQLYILGQLLVLAPLLAAVLLQPRPHSAGLLVALLFFTILFATWKVELTVFQGRMTLSFAVVCLTLLLQGLQAAVLGAAVGAAVGCITRTAQHHWQVEFSWPPLHRLAFNLGNALLSAAGAAFLFEAVRRLPAAGGLGTVLGLAFFTAGYFLINTLGVSLAIAFQQRLAWLPVWQQSFLWTAPGYLASASAALGIAALFRQMGAVSLVFLPPLYIIYYAYRLHMERLHFYADKVQQDLSHIQELNNINQAVIASLATAIDAKDSMTSSHINRVQNYALALGRAAGLTAGDLHAVATGALVHDVGKLGIPDHILGKPGKLTAEEFRQMQTHVAIGTEILSPIPFPFPVIDIVQTHHERWDGLGYPQGLHGEAIPIGGRIIAVVDVFDALTSDRPYRQALSQEAALEMLQEGAGKQFDPRLVRLFEQVLPETWAEIERSEAGVQASRRSGVQAFRVDGDRAAVDSAGPERPNARTPERLNPEVAHLLAAQETLEQMSRMVVNRALALLPADTAILYLPSAIEGELSAAAVEGKYHDQLAGMSIHRGEGIAGRVAQTGQPRLNVTAAADLARRFPPEETVELSAATVVPLLGIRSSPVGEAAAGGPESLGVLAVYTTAYSVMTEHHLHLLNLLAEQAAAAIDQLRRRQSQRLIESAGAAPTVASSQ